MRMGVVPQGPLERLAFATGAVPEPLVAAFWGMGLSRVLIAGVRMGVFDALAGGPRTPTEVAETTGTDAAGMETLLNALNGFGYVSRRDGVYANAPQAAKWLATAAKGSQAESMWFFADLWDAVAVMEEGVRTGVPLDFHHKDRPPEFWEHYMRTLAQFAGITAAEIVRRVRFASPPRRLLDVGGGHGAYATAFCRKYEGLSAEVLDLPPATRIGRRLVEEQGMAERVTYREGDLREAEWGEGYDVVLIFNVLHNLSEAESVAAIEAAKRALAPGGTLVVLDSEHTGGDGDLSTTSGFNELFFFVVSGARAYPEGVMSGWMRDAGFSNVRRRKLFSVPDAVVITGRA